MRARACEEKIRLIGARLTRARLAEEGIWNLQHTVDELKQEAADAADKQTAARLALSKAISAKLDGMPAMHASRAGTADEKRGRGGIASLPFIMRVLVYGQLARMTPPRAVGPNIVASMRAVAPWHRVDEPECDAVCKMRSEMTIVGVRAAFVQARSRTSTHRFVRF
eukprot:411815-Pleurochrysis_carterae.AAC.1